MNTVDYLPEKIVTRRLIVRVAQPGDGAPFNQAIVESSANLKRWLPWLTPLPSVEQSERFCRQAYARFLMNQDLTALFFSRASGELVGGGGLHNANWDLRCFEIGYWGRTQFLGKGLISEATDGLLHHAMNTLRANRVHLSLDETNGASQRLAERVGFEYEGTLRFDRRNANGQLRNTRVYSVIRRPQA